MTSGNHKASIANSEQPETMSIARNSLNKLQSAIILGKTLKAAFLRNVITSKTYFIQSSIVL